MQCPPIRHITALFHNPHWECFARDETGRCAPYQKHLFETLLRTYKIDFAGLAMGDDHWAPPSGYRALRHRSGIESHTLVWRLSRWHKEAWRGAAFQRGRACILARFRSRRNRGLCVVVASMHYPHTRKGSADVGEAIRCLCQGHTSDVLFMADTNSWAGYGQLMTDLGFGGQATTVRGTPLVGTCCADRLRFDAPFDRIWSNFGARMRSVVDADYAALTQDLKYAPPDVKHALKLSRKTTAAWHHPVMARLSLTPDAHRCEKSLLKLLGASGARHLVQK